MIYGIETTSEDGNGHSCVVEVFNNTDLCISSNEAGEWFVGYMNSNEAGEWFEYTMSWESETACRRHAASML